MLTQKGFQRTARTRENREEFEYMPVTKSNNSSHEDHGDKLSVEQLNAIDILVLGKTDQETATTVGVARETVNRWRNENPYFAAELNKQRK